MTENMSHDEYIKQGIEDYRNSFGDWDLDMMIDQIINLSALKSEIEKVIQEMKLDLLKNYEEIQK